MSTIEFNTKKEAINRQKLLKEEYKNTKIDITLNNKYVVIFSNKK